MRDEISEGRRLLMLALKYRNNRLLVISLDFFIWNANATAKAQIDEPQNCEPLPPMSHNFGFRQIVRGKKCLPAFWSVAVVLPAFWQVAAQIGQGLLHLFIRNPAAQLLLRLHLLQNKRAIGQSARRPLERVATRSHSKRFEGREALLLLHVALQQHIAIDDGDHAIEHHGLRRLLSRRGGFLRARPPQRQRQRQRCEDCHECERVLHQKACPMLKKKLKCDACPTCGGIGWPLGKVPYVTMTGKIGGLRL